MTLDAIAASISSSPDVAATVRGFVPPPRFRDKRFGTYHPRHPTQERALERLAVLGSSMGSRPALLSRLFRPNPRYEAPPGLYLDGGFGVGKTHLLAALWNAAPPPSAYLSFDELMYFVGVAGSEAAAEAFRGYRLLAIDEWEMDDPGNLRLALAFLRPVLKGRTRVVVTSNTLPLELGVGRFSQKDFSAEVEDLAGSFGVIRIEGGDYRRRQFEERPGRGYLLTDAELGAGMSDEDEPRVRTDFDGLLEILRGMHPIHYRQLATRIDSIAVAGMGQISRLPDALRWVHFVDSLYDAGIRMRASGDIALVELFRAEAMSGPFGKKLARCLSRLEEMLGESGPNSGSGPGTPTDEPATG